MTEIVTYVEMTDRSQLNPGAEAPGLVLVAAAGRRPLVCAVMSRVGAPYGWRSAHRTPQEWQAWFAEHPTRGAWLLTVDDEPAGVVCYDPHPGPEVEIKTFGLLPEYTGRGLGGHALPNYLRRGLRAYRTEEHDG